MVTDFIYDNIRLSDLGYAIVSFDGAINNEIDTDSKLSFNHINTMRGKQQSFITATYEDPLTMELYIARNGCLTTTSEQESLYNISLSEMAFLKRWLVRATPHKLKIDDSEYAGVYWMGSFNLEEYVLADKRIGAHLTFECDAPFGYMEDVMIRGTASQGSPFKFNCTSDEIGYIYPFMEIALKEDGDLKIKNSADDRTMIINNCKSNEVIQLTSDLQISSSLPSHKIYDDFNFEFYRVNNSFMNVENSIESNLAIDFTLIYTPYAKVVIV